MIFTKKWLKKVRQRPEEDQRVIALSLSFCFTAFIIVIWVMTLFGTIETPTNITPNFALPDVDFNIENQAGIIESIGDFFKGEETYVID
jgi:hypothetical protein